MSTASASTEGRQARSRRDRRPPTTGDGTWYVDADEDGFGDATSSESSCDGGPGQVDNGLDCDDTNPEVNPTATEVCNDGLDNDCDGTPNTCVWDASYDMGEHLLVEPQCEGAGIGGRILVADLDGDAVDELILGGGIDCADGSTPLMGGVYGFETTLTADATGADAAITIYGEQERAVLGPEMGTADLDGDGYTDLVLCRVGVSGDVHFAVGAMSVVLGPVTGAVALASVMDWNILGPDISDYVLLGDSTRVVGDVDGDGRPDFAASSLYADTNANASGGAWLFTTLGTGTDDAEDVATATVYGTELEEQFGKSTCGADLDADGHSDWVLTARSSDEGGVFVFYGPVTGDLAPSDADLIFEPETGSHDLAESCDALDDANQDGVDDITFGARETADGTAYVVWGSSSLASMSLSDADLKIRGDVPDHKFAFASMPAGDVNQDGWADLIVADSSSGGTDQSDLYLFFGPLTTRATLGASDADVVFEGNGVDDFSYEAAYGGADVTGDSVPDMVVGSVGHNDYDGVYYIIPGIGY